MKITFLVQSGFVIEYNGLRIWIDVWLSNPVLPMTVESMPIFDYLFCTHDHGDHGLQDMIALAKRDGCPLVANVETAKKAMWLWVDNAISCAMGWEFSIGEKISVYCTRAIHSSESWFPMGFIIRIGDKIVYHMGDTEYFSDLKIYAEWYNIDVLMVPMGGRYTMWPREAAYAIRDLQPTVSIPIHYNLSDKTKQNPEDLLDRIQKIGAQSDVRLMQFGETIQL